MTIYPSRIVCSLLIFSFALFFGMLSLSLQYLISQGEAWLFFCVGFLFAFAWATVYALTHFKYWSIRIEDDRIEGPTAKITENEANQRLSFPLHEIKFTTKSPIPLWLPNAARVTRYLIHSTTGKCITLYPWLYKEKILTSPVGRKHFFIS